MQPMNEGNLSIGWASADITPVLPVRLGGQFYERLSTEVQTPLQITVMALETCDASGHPIEQMMIGSCDLVGIEPDMQEALRRSLAPLLPDFDPAKLMLNATHTHNGPELVEQAHSMVTIHMERFLPQALLPDKTATGPGTGYLSVREYKAFFNRQATQAFCEAWRNRSAGQISWQLGHAVIGHNRRVVFRDGTARLYGLTDTPDYLEPEGYTDHGVELLYCFDSTDRLTGVAVNLSCPSQVMEGQSCLSADFWGEARKQIGQRYPDPIFILPWYGAGGDQSPRDLVRRGRGEPNMREAAGAAELGRRIVNTILDKLEEARNQRVQTLVFRHVSQRVALTLRTVTDEEARQARQQFEAVLAAVEPGRKLNLQELVSLHQPGGIMDRYEVQQKTRSISSELHVIRLGDIAIVTNPFEVFTQYGLQIKARSKALQTFIIQFCCDRMKYLPTEKAIRGGHYSAVVSSGLIGSEGGRQLVDWTVGQINQLM